MCLFMGSIFHILCEKIHAGIGKDIQPSLCRDKGYPSVYKGECPGMEIEALLQQTALSYSSFWKRGSLLERDYTDITGQLLK